MAYAIFAMMGYCGTKYPRWWKGPIPPPPEPWWSQLVAAVGGVLGGILVRGVVGGLLSEAPVLLACLAGAFAGGNVLSGVAGSLFAGAGAGADQIAQRKAVA